MSKLLEALKGKSRIQYVEFLGEKLGVRILTIAEAKEHAATLEAIEDDAELASIFMKYFVDEDGEQALTVEDAEKHLRTVDLKRLVELFNEANGLSKSAEELAGN